MEGGQSTKRDIITKLSEGKYILQEKPISDRSNNSVCWRNFKVVVEKETNNPVGYVQCIQEGCRALLIYKGSTTGMIRHTCKQSTSASSSSTRPTVSKKDKDLVRDMCVLWCAKDLRPFSIVADEGFINISQEMANMGSKYGKINAKQFLPCPKTVSRHVEEMADQIRVQIIPKVKDAISKNECSFTCDLWTDNYKKIHYLTVTSAHIEEEKDKWTMKNNVLITIRFPDVTKTGENILTEIEEQMAELNISSTELRQVTFVTDQGANIKKALENHKKIPCMMHCLNTALKHTLKEEFLEQEVPSVLYSIQSARKVIGYFKRSGAVSLLERTLHQDIEIRWNSISTMLESFHSQRNEIENIMIGKGKEDMLADYQPDIMEGVIEFLKSYKEATSDLEADKEPTLPYILPWIYNLLDNCQLRDGDSEALQKIKQRAEKMLKEKVLKELHSVHFVATFLHPSFKELSVLSQEERDKIHQDVRQMCSNVRVTEYMEDSSPSPVRKFRKWCASASRQKDDVEKYLNMDAPRDLGKSLLFWWGKYSSSLPHLAKVAKEVLCIPSSSASSERNFSRAIADRRSSIDPHRVNDILMIHNNLR